MYSIVIATYNRYIHLFKTLSYIDEQLFKADKVVIIDSSDDLIPEDVAQLIKDKQFFYKKVNYKSAAKQRNEGATYVQSEYVIFVDDDVEFVPSFFKKIFDEITPRSIAALAPRQVGAEISSPGKFLKFYYRLQAGYNDESYGAKLFGAGINCYPCYQIQTQPLLQAEWLPSTCLIIKLAVFEKFKFPLFDGYSFGEDVYLTASIAKEFPIYWLNSVSYIHHSIPTDFKKNTVALNKMIFNNQKLIAEDIIGLKGIELRLKLLLHKVFLTVSFIKNGKNVKDHLYSIWS